MWPYWLDGVDQTVTPVGIGNVTPSQLGRRKIPLLSMVQALDPAAAIGTTKTEGVVDEMLTDLSLGPHAFAVEVQGSSMEPDYRAGDRVVIDPAVCPSPGDSVLASINGDAVLRRYLDRSSGPRRAFELAPANPSWPTTASDSPGSEVRIIGTVMEHRRYRRR